MLLDFLYVEDDHDLRAEVIADADYSLEGEDGGLEILHPCKEIPGKTKHSALYDPSDEADKIRASFFLCRRDIIIETLKMLKETKVSEALRALLDEGCAAISDRVKAFKGASLPDCCTPQLAWDTLRKAIAEQSQAENTYDFIVQELQLFMAALRVQVEIYSYKE